MTPTDPELVAELREQAGCEGWTIHVRMMYERAANALEAASQRETAAVSFWKNQLGVQEARTKTWHDACDAAEARAQQLDAALTALRDRWLVTAQAVDANPKSDLEDTMYARTLEHCANALTAVVPRADTQEPTP